MFALTPAEIKFTQNRVSIGQKPGFERVISPGPGNQTRAYLRADFILVGVNDELQGGRVNQTLFSKDGFQSLDP